MKKTTYHNKPIYLELSQLNLSKDVMYEFLHGYKEFYCIHKNIWYL